MQLKFPYSRLMLQLIVLAVLLNIFSCRKILDVKPEDKLDKQQVYRNVFDADAAVWGIYGKFMNLAERYELLNELRADLMETTANADENLRELSTHSARPGNPYINPQPFYEVILNCNDALKNFNVMLQDKKLKLEEYNERYSDIAALRTWVYLQLGIHYGSVPYVTDALENVQILHDASKFPKISFNQLLDSMITTMETLPTKEDYPVSASLRTTVDQYNTQKFFINKYALLGDLYLWRGRGGDFQQAAVQFKRIMETGAIFRTDDNTFFQQYKIYQADVVNNNDISVGYIRFRETDQNALIDNNNQGWRSIFARPFGDQQFNWEWIWALPFDKNFISRNPFIDLFSPVGGQYLVMPSQAAVDNWNSQVQLNNFPYDARGLFTYRNILGRRVIMKYLYNYLEPTTGLPTGSIFDRNSKWFLYRAATVHLHYAEAANRDGRHKIAYAIVNSGIKNVFDDPSTADNTNEMQTFDIPPYDFNARQGDPPGPIFRDEWYRGVGIRGRAFLKNLPVVGDSTLAIEDMTVNESALELAYEGQRWGDLLRIALRRNDPSFLANKIYDKLKKDNMPGAEAARSRLMNKDNWYLPFNW
ncbi:MAG: RagB/SusD family nutrient uptake outer membrane protein [Flavisolibacter sp.]